MCNGNFLHARQWVYIIHYHSMFLVISNNIFLRIAFLLDKDQWIDALLVCVYMSLIHVFACRAKQGYSPWRAMVDQLSSYLQATHLPHPLLVIEPSVLQEPCTICHTTTMLVLRICGTWDRKRRLRLPHVLCAFLVPIDGCHSCLLHFVAPYEPLRFEKISAEIGLEVATWLFVVQSPMIRTTYIKKRMYKK